MRKPKAKPSLRVQLRTARRFADEGWEKARSYAKDAGEFQARASRLQSALEERVLRVARLEGYIQRIHEIEAFERQTVASQAAGQSQRDDAIAVLRNHVANGPEEHAQRILDAIDSDPTGKTMEAVLSGDGAWAR